MLGNLEKSIREEFGAILRTRRIALGLSQEKLAFDANLNRNYISLLELGRNQPTVTVLFRLASVLGMQPSMLISQLEKAIDLAGSEPWTTEKVTKG
jgi:transcriptional regulator with XRE-family HTH domain